MFYELYNTEKKVLETTVDGILKLVEMGIDCF